MAKSYALEITQLSPYFILNISIVLDLVCSLKRFNDLLIIQSSAPEVTAFFVPVEDLVQESGQTVTEILEVLNLS